MIKSHPSARIIVVIRLSGVAYPNPTSVCNRHGRMASLRQVQVKPLSVLHDR